MQAYVMRSIEETGVVEKDRPEAGPNDAVVRPTKALVCTSDVHTVHGAIGEREDITLGHEVVVENTAAVRPSLLYMLGVSITALALLYWREGIDRRAGVVCFLLYLPSFAVL